MLNRPWAISHCHPHNYRHDLNLSTRPPLLASASPAPPPLTRARHGASAGGLTWPCGDRLEPQRLFATLQIRRGGGVRLPSGRRMPWLARHEKIYPLRDKPDVSARTNAQLFVRSVRSAQNASYDVCVSARLAVRGYALRSSASLVAPHLPCAARCTSSADGHQAACAWWERPACPWPA